MTTLNRSDPFVDPPPLESFWQGSELERMVAAAETATDQFVAAVDAHSAAEAAYLRAYHTQYAIAAGTAKSGADADRQAAQATVEEKITEKRAEGTVESCKALVRTRLAVLNAAQSHMRFVERQT